jgi:integrase
MKDLTVKEVAALRKPGKHRVSRNLYLQIEGGSRTWLFRYMRHGVAHWQGLGSCDLVTLAEARDKALACRKMLHAGIDPIEHERAQRMQALLATASTMTFRQCAETYIRAHEASWRNDKHRAQWPSTLETYAYPMIGALPVQAVDTGLVMKILEPIWTTKPETASRVRGRIEAVLDWATVRTYRSGPNPARWKGHLDKLLPAKGTVRPVKHHAALPYAEHPAFMQELREQNGIAARALEVTILTTLRTGAVIGAERSELDYREKVWTVPKERMKWKNGQTPRDHKVPLSDRVIGILEELPREQGSDYIFIGNKPGRSLSNMAMLKLLDRMGRGELTTHGFRSTFKDWASETTGHPDIVVEMALAHAIPDKVERAYRRGDLFAKRVRLMNDWARFCTTPPQATGEVVDFAQRR